jgi:hypothetical protein
MNNLKVSLLVPFVLIIITDKILTPHSPLKPLFKKEKEGVRE